MTNNLSSLKQVPGGVCAAQGFVANGLHCGIRQNQNKKDLALVVSEIKAEAAALYTKNKVKAAPLTLCKEHLADGTAQAIICNSGNANACTTDGSQIANQMAEETARQLKINPQDVIVASTGVIGQSLPLEPIKTSLSDLVANLGSDPIQASAAAEAILTTDTEMKQIAVEFEIDGQVCTLGGMAKGSGMIHPDLATMLVFLTTDVNVSSDLLQEALTQDVAKSFNMLSVDGDTSTNDFVCILANGLAGNKPIKKHSQNFETFMLALNTVTVALCKMIAADGEGATRMLECQVKGAVSEKSAQTVAKSVITSSLVKTAIFGSDANWGRVLAAVGYSGEEISPDKVDVFFKSNVGVIQVCSAGQGLEFDEIVAKNILIEPEIEIIVNLNQGKAEATAWGCDLSHGYVDINSSYRS